MSSLTERTRPRLADARRVGTIRPTEAPIIGLIAGNGRFPIHFAKVARAQGFAVSCVGVKYEAEPELQDLCDTFDVVGVAKLGKMIRTFRRRGVKNIVMAGKVTKNVMYTPWRMVQLCPDLRTIQWWHRRTRTDNRDDSILLSLIAEFERDGMTFGSALDYCPELLVKEGLLTRTAPTQAEREDIEFGWTMAKEMGRLDVGQSVAIKEKATLAIEAIEGTDLCIERAGELCRAGGWTLVKVAKPQQDMRFDVPTVGLVTIENLRKARARVLAIEADMTIVIDQAEVIERAERYGISIIAVRDGFTA